MHTQLPHYQLLGIEIAFLTEEKYKAVLRKLNMRGLLNYAKFYLPPGQRYLASIGFPEKGRERFLRRHLVFLENLKLEMEMA